MTKQRVANVMLEEIPWDGTELAAPLTLPGALLAPTYLEQKLIAKPANPPAGSLRLYPKADGKYYQLDATGNESVISGQTKAQNDALYLPLAGGTLTGPLTATSIAAQSVSSSGAISAGGDVVIGGNYKWGQATDPESLYKEMPNRLRLSGAQLTIDSNLNVGTYTQLAEIATPGTPNTSQVRLYAKADHHVYIRDTTGVETDISIGFTKEEADLLYPHKTDLDPYPQYLTPAEGDARYALVPGGPSGGYLTQTTADTLYPRKTDVDPYPQYLTPAEADVLYAPIVGGGYLTQTQADTRYLQLTGGTISGFLTLGANLVFSGGASRIVGDFSNASVSARALFRTSTANGFTSIGVIPNGSAVAGFFSAYNSDNPTNVSRLDMGIDNTSAFIQSAIVGTGTYLPLTFWNNNVERMRIAVNGTITAGAATIASGSPNQPGFLGNIRNGDFGIGTRAAGAWLRISSAQQISFWANDGAFTADSPQMTLLGSTGKLTVSGDIQGRWLYATDGANGVVQALNGDLYLRSASTNYRMDSGGTLFCAAVSGTSMALSSSLSVGNGLTVTSHTMMSQATGGIGSGGGSEGQLELQNAGSGASKIAFHRVGAYAAYFGLDTDNVWRVGGWSMGAVAYQIWHSGNFNYSSGIVGSYLVQRSPEGYIYSNYFNCTADVPAGRPAYVWGDNGDQFARRWPIAAIGPPSLWYSQFGNGGAVAVPRTGYYVVYFTASATGGSNCGDAAGSGTIYRNGGAIASASWNDNTSNAGTGVGPFVCNAGDTISCGGGSGRGFGSFLCTVCSVPTFQYPG